MEEKFRDMDKLKQWFEWMTSKVGKLDNITSKSPLLSKSKAFSILYSLQEFLHVISDDVEMCKDCKELINLYSGEGDNIDRENYSESGIDRKPKLHEEGNYCEDCARSRFGFR